MSRNQFSKVMAKKSDSELKRVVNSAETYADEARLAAAVELKSRGAATGEVEQVRSELTNKLEAEREVMLFEAELISKNSIYLWAFVVTPLAVGPFMAFNIWELGNKKGIWAVLGITALYVPVMIIVLSILPEKLTGLVFVVHMAYTVFCVEWTWKKYLPTFEEYRKAQNESQ